MSQALLEARTVDFFRKLFAPTIAFLKSLKSLRGSLARMDCLGFESSFCGRGVGGRQRLWLRYERHPALKTTDL